MPQATRPGQIHIHGPTAGLQISLQRGDQGIDARIEHRAAVEVDDPMAASPVVTGPQTAFRGALQGDQGAIAVAEPAGCLPDGLHRHRQLAQPLQGLTHQIRLQLSLAPVLAVQQAAASAAARKDAGGTLPIR